MNSNTSAATSTRARSVMGRFASRLLEHHLDDDHPGVAAPVDRLLYHLKELLQDDELLCPAGPVVELLQFLQHHLVGLGLRQLQPVVGLADRLYCGAVAELLHHEDEGP